MTRQQEKAQGTREWREKMNGEISSALGPPHTQNSVAEEMVPVVYHSLKDAEGLTWNARFAFVHRTPFFRPRCEANCQQV
jgi:hypothetical protein